MESMCFTLITYKTRTIAFSLTEKTLTGPLLPYNLIQKLKLF